VSGHALRDLDAPTVRQIVCNSCGAESVAADRGFNSCIGGAAPRRPNSDHLDMANASEPISRFRRPGLSPQSMRSSPNAWSRRSRCAGTGSPFSHSSRCASTFSTARSNSCFEIGTRAFGRQLRREHPRPFHSLRQRLHLLTRVLGLSLLGMLPSPYDTLCRPIRQKTPTILPGRSDQGPSASCAVSNPLKQQ